MNGPTQKGYRPVYPRVYGGTPLGFDREFAMKGLSPRVRGNPVVQAALGVLRRSIPACTGEPVGIFGMMPVPGVYPRVYGGTP